MRRSKRFIIVAVIAIVVIAGSIGGVVLAQAEGDDNQPRTLFDRVADILVSKDINVTSEQLKEAFTQAQSDMRNEALDNYLQKLVDEGKINEDQARQYKEWLQAKPDLGQYRQQLKEWAQGRPDLPQEFKEWQQDMPPLPGPFGRFSGHGGFRSMGGMRVFGGLCIPTE